MFSRGKDSLCAWINLRKYFSRIIPFHCSSIPHMEFVDRTLDYYEMMFQTKILRMVGEDLTMALVRHVYQEYPWECDSIDEEIGPIEDYNKLLILSYLRKEYNLPRAWCAVGISMYDSIDRMIYCKKYKGKKHLLRFCDKLKSYRLFMCKMNQCLNKFIPGCTSYYARHSAASIAAELDVPLDTIARMLGHMDSTRRVTLIYVDFNQNKVDEANRKVIDYVLYNKR